MTAFPDLHVHFDALVTDPETRATRAIYHCTLTGTNAGLGGTGNSVRISGYAQWQISSDGPVATSQGHFDAAVYTRQLQSGQID